MDEEIARTTIVPELIRNFETEVCPKCPLFKRRLAGNYVAGSGSSTPRLIFIGEAPGENEVERGIPFVGRAGSVVNEVNSELGLFREDTYFTNAVKCHPQGNEAPPTEAVQLCRNLLEDELKQFANQNVRIVTLGNIPLRSATQDYRKTITKSRAKWVDMTGPGFSFKTLPTFHPAYVLRNPSMKRFMQSDIRRALMGIGVVDPTRVLSVPEGTLISEATSDSIIRLQRVFSGKELVLDIETNDQLNPRVGGSEITMVGLLNERRDFVQLTGSAIRVLLPQYLPDYKGLIIGHNVVQFDLKWLLAMDIITWQAGLNLRVFDTLYAWKLADDNRPEYTLASAARELNYLDYKGLFKTNPRLYNLYDLLVTRSLYDYLIGEELKA